MGDVPGHLTPELVGDVDVLDEGVEFEQRLEERFLSFGIEALHHVAFHHFFDKVSRQGVSAFFQQVELADEVLGQVAPRPALQFLVGNRRVPSLVVLVHHPLMHFQDAGMSLVQAPVIFETQALIDPVGDAGNPGLVGHDYADGPFEELPRIEDVIDLLVFHQAVGVNARARRVELLARERVVRRHPVAQLRFEVLDYVRNRRGIDAVEAALESQVLEYESFYGGVTGALAKAEQRAVRAAAPVEPGGGGVYQDLVKVVVAVPFEQVAGNAGIIDEGPHQFRNAPGQGRARIGDAEAQCVAEPDLDVNPAFLPEAHQLDGHRDAEPVDVRAGYVLEVAPGNDASFNRRAGDAQVLFQCALTVELELEKDMVVGDRGENPGLLEPEARHQVEVLFNRPDPPGYLGIVVPLGKAGFQRLAVLIGVEEELRLADYAVRTREAMQELEDSLDLPDRVGRARLLPVPEGRVGDEHLLGRVDRNDHVVEIDTRRFLVREDITHQVRLIDVRDVFRPASGVFVVQDSFFRVPAGHMSYLLLFPLSLDLYAEFQELVDICP